MFPFSIRSRYFEVVISFKPFNSTGATSLLNHFNGVSFEWALTHRSFPRILPDSSNFSGVILKFIAKFDVRMNYHQSNVFHQYLSNSFIVGSPFYSSFRSANNSWWWFSSSFSTFEDRRRVFLQILSVLSKICDSSLMPSSHNYF